jgi:rhodanese-related sulfurtransferase
MKKLIAVVSMATAALLLASCSSTSTATNLDAAAFSAKTAEVGVITLDVRTPGEFMVGHIQGAINIDVEGLKFETEIAQLDKSATYAVYCHSGRRSAIAVETMHHNGFNSLFNLTNGIADWQANNLPLVTS